MLALVVVLTRPASGRYGPFAVHLLVDVVLASLLEELECGIELGFEAGIVLGGVVNLGSNLKGSSSKWQHGQQSQQPG